MDTTSRPHFFSTSVTNRSSTSASASIKHQSGKVSAEAKIRGKKENLKPRNIPFEPVQVHDEAMEVDNGSEEPSHENTLMVEVQPSESTEAKPDDLQPPPFEKTEENSDTILPLPLENVEEMPNDIQPQPQSPPKESTVEPIPVDNLDITAEQVVEDEKPFSTPDQPVNRQIQLIEGVGHQTPPINSHIDQIIFKTPIGITPISRMRGKIKEHCLTYRLARQFYR